MGVATRKIEILNAASKVVADRGIFNLTIEAVAIEAGISKGGLLYHYPSKEVLVEKMVEHLAENYQEKIEKRANLDQEEKGKWTRAYLDVTFNRTYQNKDMNAGLLAAKAINPELLAPIREVYSEWQEAVDKDEIDQILATIVRLAADGMWLSDLFDLHPIDAERKAKVYETLTNWISENKENAPD